MRRPFLELRMDVCDPRVDASPFDRPSKRERKRLLLPLLQLQTWTMSQEQSSMLQPPRRLLMCRLMRSAILQPQKTVPCVKQRAWSSSPSSRPQVCIACPTSDTLPDAVTRKPCIHFESSLVLSNVIKGLGHAARGCSK